MPAFDPSQPPEDCPFCKIAETYPPYNPLYPPPSSPFPSPSHSPSSLPTPPTTTNSPSSPTTSPPFPPTSPTPLLSRPPRPNLNPTLLHPFTYILLSTPLCLAFLDIMPLSPGHLLLTTRAHKEKISDVDDEEAGELGRWLPVLSRVLAAVAGVWDWNIVQNNGAAAAQVVGHVHYHIIPRPGLTDELRNRSFTMFGRGQRTDLDDEEASELIAKLRAELAREVERIDRAKGRL